MDAGKPHVGGLLGLGVLGALFGWWTVKDGAYFGAVLLPGTVVLCAAILVLARAGPWRIDLRGSPAAALALAALVALGLWAGLSAFWSPAPDVAIADAQRILVYALCFGCGLWFGALLGRRPELAAAPLVIAAGIAGIATVIVLLTGENAIDYLETDGTLDYPLGYRNATAAFFAISLFPALALASARELDWRLRGVALGVATVCASLFLYCQSRASLPALAIAVLVYLIVHPRRLRAVGWLGLAILPALVTLPAAINLHEAGDGTVADAVDEMRDAGVITAIVAGAVAIGGALVARFDRRIRRDERIPQRANRAVAAAIVVAVAMGAVAFVAAVGDPFDWTSDRLEEFSETRSPDLSEQATRFSFDAGSNRYDLWRVALDEFAAAPFGGTGGGGFEYAYLRERVNPTPARNAHSVELEVLSELGLPGLVLLAVAVAAAGAGVLRAIRRRSAAATVGAAALATGTYWLLHSSIDWFWPYAALTAPVFALLGAAAFTERPQRQPSADRLPVRLAVLVAIAILGLSTIPFFLSERYVDSAFSAWRTDRESAYEDLDRAASLNPFDDYPLLAEAVIARAAGDRERALSSLDEAIERRPEEWTSHYLLAVMKSREDPATARAEVAEALRLNPHKERARALAERLRVPVPPLPD